MAIDPERESREDSPKDVLVRGVLSGEAVEIDTGGDETPALVRGVLIRAEAIRKGHIDPGDAYIMGIHDRAALDSALAEVEEFESLFGDKPVQNPDQAIV